MYFDNDNNKQIKYTQEVILNGPLEDLEKYYSSAEKLCIEENNISGMSCNLIRNEENNELKFQFNVVLSELEEGLYYQIMSETSKNLTYDNAVKRYDESDTPWKCETYFE